MAFAAALGLLATACTDDGGSTEDATATTVPASTTTTTPASRLTDDGPLRAEISAERPLFLHNVYLGAETDPADQIAGVREIWPDDLEPRVGVQLVLPAQPPAPAADSERWIDAALDATDDAGLPAIVQSAALGTRTAPDDATLGALFDAHPSLVGVGAAEFSAPFAAATQGLAQSDVDLLVDLVELASAHRAYFLWQDMGYFGPQVFVDAGADERLAATLRDHADHVILQVKRNGSAKRFVTDAAVAGWWLSGQVGHWGLNSEDWLWWEAGYERRFAPQLAGPLGVAGFPRSASPNKARLSSPESLFGAEALVAAASGATVFSIESPTRAYGDLATGRPSVAATEVVFPTLRAILRHRLIASRRDRGDAVRAALVIDGRNDPALDFDAAFQRLYGPAECGADAATCDRGQWLPKTNRYGVVPILPATSPGDVLGRFRVLSPAEVAATPLEELAAPDAPSDAGGAWIAAVGDAWIVVNPWENVAHTATADVTIEVGGEEVAVHVELPTHAFAVIAPDGDSFTVEVNDYRSSETWWDPAVADADAEAAYLAGATPDAPERVLVAVIGQGIELRDDDDAVVPAGRFERDLRGRVVLSGKIR